MTKQEFIQIVRNLLDPNQDPAPNQTLLFMFESTIEAAYHNAIVLDQYNFDVHAAISAQSDSLVMFGSEFKHPDKLQKLLEDHPRWEHLKQILLTGATFPLKPISPADRLMDLEFHLQRGNHQSATRHKAIPNKLITDDIKGFALPLPIQLYKYLPNASIAPLGCHEQETINEAGDRIPKFRMTHNQSFPGLSGQSVNLTVEKDQAPPCMYSFVLSRVLHYIVDVCRHHPDKKIFLCKFNLDSAYRHCHLSGLTASWCMVTSSLWLSV